MNGKMDNEFWKSFDKTVSEALVPRFSLDTARPCSEEDFKDFRKSLSNKINCIASLLDIVIKNTSEWTAKIKKNMIKVIVIVGEEHCKKPWNTDGLIKDANTLISKICKIFESESLTELLKDDDIFLSIVMFLRPKLMKDSWKSFPAAAVCYKWLLQLTEKPMLKRHVPELLPTALIIFDDYVHENQKTGLECINLIIEHCNKSRSLKNLNYDEVIFQALEKMAYKVETDMIIPLYSCISELLENIRYCEDSKNEFGWTKTDEVLSILLNNMELQTNYSSRYAYVISLNKLFDHSSSGKWSERLARIFSEYCEDNTDLKTTVATLDLVKSFLNIYQPKSFNFYTAMYSALLKLRYKLKLSKCNDRVIIENIDSCISTLNDLCPNLSKNVLSNDIIKSVVSAM